MQRRATSRADLKRRGLLMSIGAGAMGSLAGCIGDDTDPGDVDLIEGDPEAPTIDPDDVDDEDLPEGAYVDGQDLILVTPNNPEEVHFSGMPGDTVITDVYDAANDVFAASHEPGIWGRFWLADYWAAPGDPFFGFYDSVEIESDTITAVIRDDVYWSDGEPVIAKDAIATHALWVLPPDHDRDLPWDYGPGEARFHGGFIGSFSVPDGMDGKVFEWHIVDNPEWEEVGGFEAMSTGEIWARMGGTPAVNYLRNGPNFPSHLDRWEDIWDERIQQWEERDPDFQERTVFLNDRFDGQELAEWSREPGNVPTHGAWTLAETVGTQEIVLEKNEHYRHVDDINFDSNIFEYSEDDPRIQAGLRAGRFDAATTTMSPDAVDEIPGTYTQVTSPSAAGHSLGINHNSPLGDVKVRQAIMYALDSPSIAQNIHPDAAAPIDIPGWDMWAADAVLDESWARENLIDYSQDLDRAEQLMQEAGWSRGGDDLWEDDGQPFQTVIATPENDPVMELTVQDQLANFGFDWGVQTFESATFAERRDGSDSIDYIEEEYGGSGDFDVWQEGWLAGFYEQMADMWWGGVAHNTRVRSRNLFTHEIQEEGMQNYADSGWVEGQYDIWFDWLVSIPPIGEPDAEPSVEWNPGYVWGAARTGPLNFDSPYTDNEYYNPPHDEPHPENADYWWQKFAWTANWLLPVLPFARGQNQNFLNTANWEWPFDHDMFEFYQLNWNAPTLATQNLIAADVSNPKDGAEVVDR